ncbi:2-dehydropantoate 2-reductase [Methylobacterium sp. 37f]|uniref:ketopantoate reductase family protein n=1 Tax=Methylobacterium sp. 37f TaxID=2817058 RepID=UPI001FFD04CD|nr:2-dehydropantoate 2-reductase [Methylobacterium sp. 37f]MCK2052858.1 2-dehydropantoate 2-reductase [Methylobacterium sp. 37f]
MTVAIKKVASKKVAIVGAGSVGCYYGSLLARSGLEVVLVGRRPLVDAVEARGLWLEIGDERIVVQVRATTAVDAVAGAEWVLVCVKSGDTEATGRAIAPHLRPDATVLSFQNGVDNPERLQAVLHRPVVPVAVYVATEMVGPGHVKHHGRGDLVIGASTTSLEIAAAFAAAGIPTQVSARAVDALWGKLVVNCAYNALSAITQLPYGRLLAVPGIASVMADVVAECVAVAEASGVAVPGDILDRVLALAAAMPDQHSSTAQDLAQGRPSEIAHLNGLIVRKGAETGVPTPVNRLLSTLVQPAEARGGEARRAEATG